MTEKHSLEPPATLPLIDTMDYIVRLNCMSLDGKLVELHDLTSQKKHLEEKLADVKGKIDLVKRYPDVSEYHVERDKLSIQLLNELRANEGTTYEEFLRTSGLLKPAELGIVLNRLHALSYAKFLDVKSVGDFLTPGATITLTERGKNAKYIEPQKIDEGR